MSNIAVFLFSIVNLSIFKNVFYFLNSQSNVVQPVKSNTSVWTHKYINFYIKKVRDLKIFLEKPVLDVCKINE